MQRTQEPAREIKTKPPLTVHSLAPRLTPTCSSQPTSQKPPDRLASDHTEEGDFYSIM